MTQRVALYARTSTADGQTVENQLRQLQEVGGRLGWVIVDVITDEGVSGTKGRDRRPGFDKLLKSVARREIDLVAAWSVDRLGRSLQDLIGFLGELQARNVGLYLHVQSLDTTTPAGRAMFAMLGVFAEFERSLIVARVNAGLERARSKGVRLGRPPMPDHVVDAIKAALASGQGIRAAARSTGASTTSVMRIAQSMANAPKVVA